MSQERKEAQLRKQLDYIKEMSETERSEILSAADKESSDETKATMDKEQHKIDLEFEKQIKRSDVKKRIAGSQKMSAARLQLLKAEDAHIQKLVEVVRAQLVASTQNTEYADILIKLVMQGVKKVEDNNVTINCLQKDLPVVKKAVKDAKEKFPKVNITVDETFFLEDKVIGGVTVASMGDRIVCNNTLEHRMNQALLVALPKVRSIVFPSLKTQIPVH
ncbi:vacuolar ATP synthase subunit E, putative [Entamoeba invadens IP1]|uniref:Vacuolar ATP synthase subunit E, putative n=1 Tax=Entamoeba invadens IP1 TaxID=370355 RepID=A0A0A1TU86_ENTIV|nr:vacuolar ATP synthase subunit E, putative [Entamoeba invadens IP1]ELP83495.1 vacuolar ATP synthase subunit E, putative [Entamoeba invadens IP1]|eukprot:XP_004182841.1 vacuolar ATP synthase subunit E, putative [Entamoeba invadens IP1]